MNNCEVLADEQRVQPRPLGNIDCDSAIRDVTVEVFWHKRRRGEHLGLSLHKLKGLSFRLDNRHHAGVLRGCDFCFLVHVLYCGVIVLWQNLRTTLIPLSFVHLLLH